jgi:FkbM family methyltransferase
MNRAVTTTVIDAGGRYGLHPTWKPFTGELQYFLFEPDPVESSRLEAKYRSRGGEITVVSGALASVDGPLAIQMFRNRAMSSSVARNPVSALFQGERLREVEIVDTITVNAHAIDSYCDRHGLSVDFLKLDTEGTECEILKGAARQLETNVLGVRSEVSFDRVFEGMPLFGALHDLMMERGFVLLNLDYDGRGDYQTDFVKSTGRYGILTASDAVWVRRPAAVLESPAAFEGDLEGRVMKLAAFLINNHASDVALDVLLRGRRERALDYAVWSATRLYGFLDVAVHRLFYDLKWQPGQSLKAHQSTFQEIFGRPMKELNEFMESEQLNPD